jgi:hypothetical protein
VNIEKKKIQHYKVNFKLVILQVHTIHFQLQHWKFIVLCEVGLYNLFSFQCSLLHSFELSKKKKKKKKEQKKKERNVYIEILSSMDNVS